MTSIIISKDMRNDILKIIWYNKIFFFAKRHIGCSAIVYPNFLRKH